MAFFKFRARGPQRNEGRSSTPAAPAESIEAMRRRARHRLLGAAVLVLLGVVGFPLLFDSQPRPVAVDIPIEIPDRNKVKPLEIPAAPPPTATARSAAPDTSAKTAVASTAHGMITEAADGSEITSEKTPAAAAAPVPAAEASKPEANAEPTPAAEAKKPEPKHDAKSEAKHEVKPETKEKSEPKPEPKAAASRSAADDGARARALLDGKKVAAAKTAAPAAPAAPDDAGGKFVVQVGAFSDPAKAREMRQKLEKAGLKTYTVVAKTRDGEFTRVRVGPFGARADADRAAGRIKGLSLPATVLSL